MLKVFKDFDRREIFIQMIVKFSWQSKNNLCD